LADQVTGRAGDLTARTDAAVAELELQMFEAAAVHLRADPAITLLTFAIMMLAPDQRRRLGGLLETLHATASEDRR
jgi:hypothetical protein